MKLGFFKSIFFVFFSVIPLFCSLASDAATWTLLVDPEDLLIQNIPFKNIPLYPPASVVKLKIGGRERAYHIRDFAQDFVQKLSTQSSIRLGMLSGLSQEDLAVVMPVFGGKEKFPAGVYSKESCGEDGCFSLESLSPDLASAALWITQHADLMRVMDDARILNAGPIYFPHTTFAASNTAKAQNTRPEFARFFAPDEEEYTKDQIKLKHIYEQLRLLVEAPSLASWKSTLVYPTTEKVIAKVISRDLESSQFYEWDHKADQTLSCVRYTLLPKPEIIARPQAECEAKIESVTIYEDASKKKCNLYVKSTLELIRAVDASKCGTLLWLKDPDSNDRQLVELTPDTLMFSEAQLVELFFQGIHSNASFFQFNAEKRVHGPTGCLLPRALTTLYRGVNALFVPHVMVLKALLGDSLSGIRSKELAAQEKALAATISNPKDALKKAIEKVDAIFDSPAEVQKYISHKASGYYEYPTAAIYTSAYIGIANLYGRDILEIQQKKATGIDMNYSELMNPSNSYDWRTGAITYDLGEVVIPTFIAADDIAGFHVLSSTTATGGKEPNSYLAAYYRFNRFGVRGILNLKIGGNCYDRDSVTQKVYPCTHRMNPVTISTDIYPPLPERDPSRQVEVCGIYVLCDHQKASQCGITEEFKAYFNVKSNCQLSPEIDPSALKYNQTTVQYFTGKDLD